WACGGCQGLSPPLAVPRFTPHLFWAVTPRSSCHKSNDFWILEWTEPGSNRRPKDFQPRERAIVGYAARRKPQEILGFSRFYSLPGSMKSSRLLRDNG